MPTYFPPQHRGQVPPVPSHGPGENYACQRPPPNSTTSSKRQVDEDDDDIQFISEKPVKRCRTSDKRPTIPVAEQPMIPLATTAATPTVAPNLPIMATQIPDCDSKDTERRLSTGMVCLPHDIHAVELAYALRGVSMPVLENFVLDQPFRKPRSPSPPELSPKQLPLTVSSAMLNFQSDRNVPEAFDFERPSSSHILCASSSHTSRQVETPVMTPDLTNTSLDPQNTHAAETLIHPGSYINPTSSNRDKRVGSNSIPMPPPPPLPYSEASHQAPCLGINPRPSENHHHHNNSTHSQKQPCQVCSRLRHQAQLSRVQGLPIVNATLPPGYMPQLHCHTSYGQHLHPQMVAIPTSNMHGFGPNFAPVMMPVNSNAFAPLPSHSQPQHLPQQMISEQQKGTEKDKPHTSERSGKPQSPQTTQPKSTVGSFNAASSPLKPPASLIQPTYRKPSPNLIVDVAETCQEKFPFEEVAKRHNVPVDKVFDVFAAIIQVPLLRCPTDRRRPGRLATARIKEYNGVKKEIRDSRADGSDGGRPEGVINSTDIAQKLGPVEFPEGFTLGGSHGRDESSGHS
ncbi:hypothetical protein F4824DRAFT_495766 [Ustulina deusta]|nr:hypothetical protein F4824DRAFT_495766 [Ustulina deusta]